MNKESSRSHSLFTLKVFFPDTAGACSFLTPFPGPRVSFLKFARQVESTFVTAEGMTKQRHSCLNLVDLAGSERQKSTHASGDRLKEVGLLSSRISLAKIPNESDWGLVCEYSYAAS